jgi:hypothetical protein
LANARAALRVPHPLVLRSGYPVTAQEAGTPPERAEVHRAVIPLRLGVQYCVTNTMEPDLLFINPNVCKVKGLSILTLLRSTDPNILWST